MESDQKYKIKLNSGRVLGPLDLERVKGLILRDQITGTEVAREYPNGEWVPVASLSAIARLLLERAQGVLKSGPVDSAVGSSTRTVLVEPTPIVSAPGPVPSLTATVPVVDQERTLVFTQIAIPTSERTEIRKIEERPAPQLDLEIESNYEPARGISTERTVVFVRSPKALDDTDREDEAERPRRPIFNALKGLSMVVVLILVGMEVLGLNDEKKPNLAPPPAVRPLLPDVLVGQINPQESVKFLAEGTKLYLLDHVEGYRKAAEKFRRAATLDPSNVKAVALLASSYLNLIDSSNKDQNYFATLSQLIDLSKVKQMELTETIIAEIEYLVLSNRLKAAHDRIVEYTKNRDLDPAMFHYLAWTFYVRGDLSSASKYAAQIPDHRAFGPKVFYLRGLIAEGLHQSDAALQEYRKALKLNPSHAKSHLRISDLLFQQGKIKEAGQSLDLLVSHPALLSPDELARALFLHAKLSQDFNKLDIALGDMERAVKLEGENHEYQLELYLLRGKVGDPKKKIMQAEAQMYFFLGEGEKYVRDGRHHEALVEYLKAASAKPESHLPFLKVGDMYRAQNDDANALENYRKASTHAQKDPKVWARLVWALIQNFEWDEAKKATDHLRQIGAAPALIHRITGDWYSKQGLHAFAQDSYKKAMSQETIDPDVYNAYAKSLMENRNFRDAPFFFALALRFDPSNIEAITNTAKCIAETESVERAISLLQDEQGRAQRASAELQTAIAELYIQKGDWIAAQGNVDQARVLDPDYAGHFKVQARIHMNRENTDKKALDLALASWEGYVQRYPSDPSGHLEKFKIYSKKFAFDKATAELAVIYARYPKYPKLHYYQGWLYAAQGNHLSAVSEYQKELANNPDNLTVLISLSKEKLELGQLVGGQDSAQDLLNRAMQAAPGHAEAKQLAGYVSYLLKSYPAAIALYSGSIALDKANPLTYKRLGLAYRDQGDLLSAKRAFQKYLEMEPDASDKAEFERYK